MDIKPASISEAKAHIAKIRHDKGLSEHSPAGHNVSDLENALTTLSEQLYQSSTHFLLELIQNADDNSYDSKVQPTVNFTYQNGYLRVDCNEVGFSPRNVEALCRVGQSTKKGGENASRYVGEKGIGFKSVFKAADVVWICSGNYSFKFDKTQQLGMIAPIWDELPALVKPGYTSLYLQLSKSYNTRGLLDELRALDSRLLIFLRRLRSITVTISEPLRPTWKNSFSQNQIGKELIRLTQNGKSCDYIIKRHQLSNMPRESKREGVKSSEIVLGFPITEQNEPKRESQQVYAFLPIRDYGFEFLIQADFLLIASREDIDDSAEWNHHLRKELTNAFVNAMSEFNKGPLRYLWPRYLPLGAPLYSFFRPFHLEMRTKLASQPMLYSHPGDLIAPKVLTYVPKEYIFQGKPITMSAQSNQRYLSSHYQEDDLQYLKTLEVSKMSEGEFFSQLRMLTLNSMAEFKKKPNSWHSHLANILVRLDSGYSLNMLQIIPLEDGTWVSAYGKELLFAATKNKFALPEGLQVSVVDSKASKDPERRKLFKILGVGDFEKEPIMRQIQKLHSHGDPGPRAALVSQIKFLYAAGFLNPNFSRFWFASECGERLHGSQLYQESSKPYSASRMFSGAARKKFQFIHKDYLAAAGKDTVAWSKWLEEKMEVATMPRLIQSNADNGYELSEDFEFLIKSLPSSEVLMLLRENWDEYSCFLDPEKAKGDVLSKYLASVIPGCAIRLKSKLKSMMVSCTNGETEKHRLDSTFIPRKDLLVAAQEGIPFVEIKDAENKSWDMLETLGVSMKVDMAFYLRSLENLSGGDDGPRIARLYSTILSRCETKSDTALVKKCFLSGNMVYMPAVKDNASSWLPLTRCRWKGPDNTQTFTCLKTIYPEVTRLFCEVLGVQDASLHDLAHEASMFAIGESLSYVTSIFHAMEKFLEDDPKVQRPLFNDLKSKHACFPVSKIWKTEKENVTALENAKVSTEWFIADTPTFRTIFAGVVPLLDIKFDDLAAMDTVLNELGLKTRFLSRNAKSIPKTHGVVEMNKELTDKFHSKIDFIIRLIPTTKQHRKRRLELITLLQNSQVYTADHVIQEYFVTYKGKQVKGPPGNGSVALSSDGKMLKIYIAAKAGLEATPMELVDELFEFCGMKADNPAHSEICLHVALSEDNPARILKVFTDKGIPSMGSLKFADKVEDPKEQEEEGRPRLPEYDETEGNAKGPSKRSRILPVAGAIGGAIIGFPVVIVVALGTGVGKMGTGVSKRIRDAKVFDGDNTPARRRTAKPKKAKKVKTPKPPREKKGPNKFWLNLQQLACPEEMTFRGELAVHKYLNRTLGANYNALHHWNSSLRTRASYPALTAPNCRGSTFKFSDTSSAFTAALDTELFPAAKNWIKDPPTYHIDVKATRGDVHAEFPVTSAEFERARGYSAMMQTKGKVPKNVYILARVYGVDGEEEAGISFIVDPWEYYHAERLVLRHQAL